VIWPAVTSPAWATFCLPMRTWLLLVILVATAACGAYRFPGPENGSGTVSGQVLATPCSPVEPAAPICVPAPGPASDCVPRSQNGRACVGGPIPSLELVFTKGDTSQTTKTDSRGNYSIELPAGTWRVNAKSFMRIISGPQTLVVTAGASIVADYIVDTGIRAASLSGPAAAAPTPVDDGAQFRTTGR
jgi:hypothetical protein